MSDMKNLNTNLDKDFAKACNLCDKNFSHNELLLLLQTGSIVEKQIAALQFDYVKSENDAKTLLSNLTGCDGKIREAIALSINRILKEDNNAQQIIANISADIFSKATIDINGNICRLVVESANILKKYKSFREVYVKNIINYAEEALQELDKFIFRDKKYVINKQLFKLYWCLDTLINYAEYADSESLDNILHKSSEQSEYTIREEVAEIIKTNNILPDLTAKMSNDENYYVRAIFAKS